MLTQTGTMSVTLPAYQALCSPAEHYMVCNMSENVKLRAAQQ